VGGFACLYLVRFFSVAASTRRRAPAIHVSRLFSFLGRSSAAARSLAASCTINLSRRPLAPYPSELGNARRALTNRRNPLTGGGTLAAASAAPISRLRSFVRFHVPSYTSSG